MDTDRRHTGQALDNRTGLMYYRARWYDPRLGRFIQADTIVPGAGHPQALSRYAYTLENRVRYVDPSRHIANDPRELACADEILQLLRDDYGVIIYKDWRTELLSQ